MTIGFARAASPVLACVEFDSNNKNKWGQSERLENRLKSMRRRKGWRCERYVLVCGIQEELTLTSLLLLSNCCNDSHQKYAH